MQEPMLTNPIKLTQEKCRVQGTPLKLSPPPGVRQWMMNRSEMDQEVPNPEENDHVNP